MAHDARTVAAALIGLAAKQDTRLTVNRLHKLLYLAHGWHLAITGRPLFNEEIEAWGFGPVVPVIHHDFRDHGSRPLPASLGSDALLDDPTVVGEIVLRVWDYYGEFSAVHLSEITNDALSPWERVRAMVAGETHRNPPIPNETIRKQFLSRARMRVDKIPLRIDT